MLNIQIKTTPETQKLLKDTPKLYLDGLISGVRKAIYLVEGKIKRSFGTGDNLKIGTGYLRNSISSNVNVMEGYIQGVIGSRAVYARIHELGGVIKPVNSNYMRFKLKGVWVTVKQVTMPARPFLEPGIKDNLGEMEKTILDEISRSINNG